MPDPEPDGFLGERLIAEVRLARYEARIAKAIERVLAALRSRVLADVRGLTAAAWAEEPLVDPLLDQVVAAEVAPVVSEIYEEVRGVIFSKVGLDAATLPVAGFERQAERLAARVRDMSVDVAGKVAETLRAGTQRGESIDDLAGRVTETFGASTYRATTIARTEVVSATNGASDDAAHVAHANGVPMQKRWLATRDARTRPTHAAADGQTRAMDQEFSVGGATLRYPGDPSGPAEEVINCRCTTLYVPIETTTETPAPEAEQEPPTRPETLTRAAVGHEEAPSHLRNSNEVSKWLQDRWSRTKGLAWDSGARSWRVAEQTRGVGLDGLNAKQARFVATVLDREFSHLPEVAERIPQVRTFRSAGYRKNAIGVASRDRFLYLKNGWFADADKLAADSARQHAAGWWSVGDPEAVIVHEFGHHVKYHVEREVAERIAAGRTAALADVPAFPAMLQRTIRNELGLDYYPDVNGPEWLGFVRGGLSKYATTNLEEVAAEGWAEYRLSPTPRPLARAIGEYFEDLIARFREDPMP